MSFLRGHFWLLGLFLALLRECSPSALAAYPQLKLKQQLLRFNNRNRNLVSLVVADDYRKPPSQAVVELSKVSNITRKCYSLNS
jgi:hypothetical protein